MSKPYCYISKRSQQTLQSRGQGHATRSPRHSEEHLALYTAANVVQSAEERPTMWAYEQVCKARDKWQDKAQELKELCALMYAEAGIYLLPKDVRVVLKAASEGKPIASMLEELRAREPVQAPTLPATPPPPPIPPEVVHSNVRVRMEEIYIPELAIAGLHKYRYQVLVDGKPSVERFHNASDWANAEEHVRQYIQHTLGFREFHFEMPISKGDNDEAQ